MGRLPKKKIDIVVQMLKQGYTASEISKKALCSESTVYRVKKEYLGLPKTPESVNSRITKELIKTIYSMLLILEFSFVLDEEDIEDITRDVAKTLTKKLAETDTKLAKNALLDSGYYENIKPLLITKPTELSKRDTRFRGEWILILRKYWPETLAELVR